MITSVNTSRKQIAASIKSPIVDVKGKKVLNYGSGKYPLLAKEHLLELGACEVVSFDPYAVNETNINDLAIIRGQSFDVVFCCNVLNVVEDIGSVVDDLMSIDTECLIVQIYEGNKTDIPKVTRDGYQQNKRTVDYKKYFDLNRTKRSQNVLIIK